MSDHIVPMKKQAAAIQPNFAPSNFQELMRFADIVSKSTFVPKDYIGKASNVLVAVQMGNELGLSPMLALQNITVINGRPSIYGDAMLALCKTSPLCEWVKEEIQGNNQKEWVAVCTVKRKGNPEVVSTFSWQDAENAKLTGKPGPWLSYPKRMLQMRARGFALRDAFPDLLNGLISQEEAQDYAVQLESKPVQQHSKPQVKDAQIIQEMPNIEPEKSKLEINYKWVVGQLTDVESKERLEKLTSQTKIINLRKELEEKEPAWAEDIKNLIEQALHTFESQEEVAYA